MCGLCSCNNKVIPIVVNRSKYIIMYMLFAGHRAMLPILEEQSYSFVVQQSVIL